MTMDNGVRMVCGCGLDRGGQRGKTWDNCNRINKNKFLKTQESINRNYHKKFG